MELKLKKLNNRGIQEFESFINSLPEGKQNEIPNHLKNDDKYSEKIENDIYFDSNKPLGTRKDAAIFLNQKFSKINEILEFDRGIWSWISLHYFKQLCPNYVENFKGRITAGKSYNYIPSTDYRYYYRHKLLGPYESFKIHKDHASILLSNAVHTIGDLNEQIASRQDYMGNKEIMKLLHKLYYDNELKCPKLGASSKSNRAGSIRRFDAFEKQISLNYDLFSMNCDLIYSLLPKEFDDFKN